MKRRRLRPNRLPRKIDFPVELVKIVAKSKEKSLTPSQMRARQLDTVRRSIWMLNPHLSKAVVEQLVHVYEKHGPTVMFQELERYFRKGN